MRTLERIQDSENVVGRDPEGTVGEEGETPGDPHRATQSQDDSDALFIHAHFCGDFLVCCSLETNEVGQYDDEGGEGEDEDQRVVTYVDNVVRGVVRYPAAENTKQRR